jgi:hypothetical protein
MEFKQDADRSALLTALISGGIIGGTVSLIEGNFEKSKFIFPAALAVGIFADYQVNKYRNYENFENLKEYDDQNNDPEYLKGIINSSMSVLTILGAGYISSRNFDHFYTGFPFSLWYTDTNQVADAIVAEEIPLLPAPEQAGGIGFIANPAVAQIGMALASGGVRRAGRHLIAQVLIQGMLNIDFRGSLQNGIDAGQNLGTLLNTQVGRLTDSISDLFSRRVEGSHLTNESTFVLSNADQSESFVILQPSETQAIEAPIIRLRQESFQNARETFVDHVDPVNLNEPRSFQRYQDLNREMDELKVAMDVALDESSDDDEYIDNHPQKMDEDLNQLVNQFSPQRDELSDDAFENL